MDNLVRLENVSKHYGRIEALKQVSFDIRAGEVHALLGENGAGKSTCMRIIRGETEPTSGDVYVRGERLTRFSPTIGDMLGIAMVHQELAVFNGLTVAENLLPKLPERTRFGFVDRGKLYEDAARRLKLFDLAVDPRQKMATLTPGQKQIVEILRAISDERSLIILDEPTSSLNAEETETLLGLIKTLRDGGTSILFVSHRIPEVLDLSDRITVLRDGHYVDTLDNQGLTEADLVSRMVGRELSELHTARRYRDVAGGKTVFSAEKLSGVRGLQGAGFQASAGEVLGFFGLEGSGTAELSRLLFGLDEALDGTIAVNGEVVEQPVPKTMIENGVTYLNSDRSEAGLFKERSIADGVTAPILDRLQRWSLIRNSAVGNVAKGFLERFAIKAPTIGTPPSALSGGNQQKVMMAACLTPDPGVVIVNEPTRGVDVGAKAEMHRKLLELADAGTAILVFSSELPELISLCDRIVVMRSNRIVGELAGEEISENAVMTLAAGSGEIRLEAAQ